MTHTHDQLLETFLDSLPPALERWYSGDPFGYAELFTDGELSYFDPLTSQSLDSSSALQAHYERIVGMVDVPNFEVVNPRLQLLGDVAVFTYNLHEYKSEGAPSLTWNAAEVRECTADGWKVIHAHWSPIPPSE